MDELKQIKEIIKKQLESLGYNGDKTAERIEKISGYYNGKPSRIIIKQPNGENLEIFL